MLRDWLIRKLGGYRIYLIEFNGTSISRKDVVISGKADYYKTKIANGTITFNLKNKQFTFQTKMTDV